MCEERNSVLLCIVIIVIFCMELGKGKIDCETLVCMHVYARLSWVCHVYKPAFSYNKFRIALSYYIENNATLRFKCVCVCVCVCVVVCAC